MSTTTISFFYLLLIFSFKCPYPAPFDQFNTVLSSLPHTTKLQAMENSNVRRDRNNDKSVPCLKFLVFLICLDLLLFYLYPFLPCIFFSHLDKYKCIHLNKLKNYFLTATANHSLRYVPFTSFLCSKV